MSSPLERAVAIMDRLRSPGGCPWDAEQTHESLARYLVEECYEVLEAIETGDRALLREELGDLLLQVLFHARLAQEQQEGDAFGIDEVAGDLVDKLVRRHPHVFATGTADGVAPRDPESLNAAWELQKISEKGRTSAADGVPLAQPALALAAKLVSRAERAGIADDVLAALDGPAVDGPTGPPRGGGSSQAEDDLARTLLATVGEAVAAGVDPEGALRRLAGRYARAMRFVEAGTVPGGADTPRSEHAEPVR